MEGEIMREIIRRILVCTVMAGLLLTLLPAAVFADTPGHTADIIGETFPDFTFTDTEGEEITLSGALSEKELVVICVFASWCPQGLVFPCAVVVLIGIGWRELDNLVPSASGST